MSSSRSNRRFGNNRQISPAKNWYFTYNNYKDEDIIKIIDIISSNNPGSKYIFQEETGEEGTRHLQGYIGFAKKIRPKGLFKEFIIHWTKCRNVKLAIAYCHKADTRTGNVYSNIKYDKDIKVIAREDFHMWQEEIVAILEEPPSDRTIHWYWEEVGNTGKTAISKWLAVTKGALVLSGKGTDMKYGIVKYKEKMGYFPEIIIFDIPRSCHNYVSWGAIEAIKNGMFFSAKYESEMCVFNSPHVVYFANVSPDMSLLSNDRWNIVKIKVVDETPVVSWLGRRFGPL